MICDIYKINLLKMHFFFTIKMLSLNVLFPQGGVILETTSHFNDLFFLMFDTSSFKAILKYFFHLYRVVISIFGSS